MKRSQGWAWLVGLIAATGVALVLLFVLSLTGEAGRFVERHIVWLYWLNLGVAALLGLVVLLAALRLAIRRRQGKFGTALLFKLAGIFTLVGVLPGVVIYTVSYQFVSRSIEVWFDVRVQGALDAGLDLGRGTLDALVADVGSKTRAAAERLADGQGNPTTLALERLREQLAAQEVAVVGASGQVLVSAGGSAANILPERPGAPMLRQARSQRVVSQIEGLDDEPAPGAASRARVRALARVPASDLQLGSEERFLLVVQPIPAAVAANALAVQGAYREYQQRALARDGLRKMYIGTLTLALLLAVFGAVLLAAVLGTQLARPLLLLAEGVRQVAAGDLTAKPVSASRDEIGGLTRSFAAMTEQLGHAREQVERGVAQLESARTHLQTILDSLTAGVIVFDAERRIETVNPGATRIFKLPLSAYRGRRLDEVPGLAGFADAVWQRFELHAASPEAGERDHWQDAFELAPPASSVLPPPPEAEALTLLVRGAHLPHDARLLVFDDISEVVSAQRQAAWSEVARRLAHEIKNPLTPIQLSAERLQFKLEPKLSGDDASLLQRSVGTIVTQVQSMKQLVNEFRDYARLPAAKLVPLDLNALVAEVLGLYGEAVEQGRLHAQTAPDLPWILGDASQLRQVVHNLVQNALDAVAERADGRVAVRTEAVRGEGTGTRAVRLAVLDNGPGFADKVLKRAFEPYVTTKARGTGLGLAVVKKIADEHGARVRIGNREPQTGGGGGAAGAQVSLSFSNLAAAPSAPAVTAHPPPDAAAPAQAPWPPSS
ncbi:MAG TPA: ATP-binding protein [Burkholderiaceae bacterium]|nr:ATP-binding protein [Burkholderiaceae bacterium]